jgi:hypothetical protein
MKLEFSRASFKKMLKYYENPISRSGVVSCGQTDGRTDRHEEAKSCFSQICESA